MTSHDGSPAAPAAAPGQEPNLAASPSAPADAGHPEQQQPSTRESRDTFESANWGQDSTLVRPFAIAEGCLRLRGLADKSPALTRAILTQRVAAKHRMLGDKTLELLSHGVPNFRRADRDALLIISDLCVEISAMALAEVERLDVADLAAERERLRREAAAAGGQGGGS